MAEHPAQRVNNIITQANNFAIDTRSSYLTVEHLLYSLLQDNEITNMLKSMGVDHVTICNLVKEYIETERKEPNPAPEPRKTLTLERTFNRAFTQTIFAGRKVMEPRDLLISVMSEKNSPSYHILRAFDVDKDSVIEQFRIIEQGKTERIKHRQQEELLKQFCFNLNEKSQDMNELIGRDLELFEVTQTLARRKKNNVMLLGEAGVGKTAIVEGLAKLITEDTVPSVLKGLTVWQLNMSALLAGTRYRGDFEERIQQLIDILQDRDDIILFVDEIHGIMGAGAVSGGSNDMANQLKPVLEGGGVKIIGATTWDEYRKHIEKDAAIMRRFNIVDVEEPDLETAKDIVRGNIAPYELHHEIVYEPSAVESVVELAKNHVHGKRLPDSAFDILDRAGARIRVEEDPDHYSISTNDIKLEISSVSNIPIELLGTKNDEQHSVVDLEESIGRVVYGQAEAITALSDSVYIAQSGLKELTKPIGCYLFTGPTGVGKTETCNQLAESLGMRLLRYDMSEYQERHSVSRLIGAPPGYEGYSEGGAGSGELINKLKESPNSILLFDEVEKAHPDVLNILLQIMDNGIVTGSNGQTANARNTMVILTSNLGAADAERNSIGFGAGKNDDAQHDAVKRHFAPEFRNRLDAVIYFKKLDRNVVKLIAKKLLAELREQVLELHNIELQWNGEALDILVEKGYSTTMGARPMKRVINEEIKKPLARNILFTEQKPKEVIVNGIDGHLKVKVL